MPFYRQSEIKFQYFLEGYSSEWSDWNSQAQKEFTNLGQGKYQFLVRANVNGKYVTVPSKFMFRILPPWYANRLALFGYFLLVVLLFLYAKHIYHLKLKRQRTYLQKKLRMEHNTLLEQEVVVNERRIDKLKNEQLQSALASKSRELANSAMNIVYKNELLQKINQEILNLKDQSGNKLSVDQLKKIQKVINEGMSDERDWNLFENSFNEAHENFFKKIKVTHPELAPNDLKLCAYLRMNMNSKEIASLLNITLRGVEIRRYRLRKKLNIEHDKNLTEFLMEL